MRSFLYDLWRVIRLTGAGLVAFGPFLPALLLRRPVERHVMGQTERASRWQEGAAVRLMVLSLSCVGAGMVATEAPLGRGPQAALVGLVVLLAAASLRRIRS